MKTRQEFQLEIENELAEIEEGIDEMRRQQREVRQRSRYKNGPSASPLWMGHGHCTTTMNKFSLPYRVRAIREGGCCRGIGRIGMFDVDHGLL